MKREVGDEDEVSEEEEIGNKGEDLLEAVVIMTAKNDDYEDGDK